ncbi:MAG: lectin [Mycobacteriales bacterium]
MIRTVVAGSMVLGALLLPALAAPPAATAAVADPASLVNPFLGTSNGGDDFPGADAPFGMVQFSPDTTSRTDGGNYDYGSSSILGFALTHVSGPGCGAAGDVPILPTTGAVNGSATASFSHGNETADAGYYKVALGNGVTTELTATTRSGMARFTFPATSQANLLFKLTGSQNGDTNTAFTVVSGTEVSGQVTTGHFCGAAATYTVYFDVLFDQPMTGNGTFSVGDSVTFNTTGNQVVQAKVGLSYVSRANAAANRAAENPNWDFAAVHTATHNAWNNLLGRIQVTGGTSAQQHVFYTSLYHALLHPNVLSDSNGQYLGFDNAVHTVSGGHAAQYGTFSGWDIYRAQAQLEALVAPDVASDTAQSMVNDYAQGGQLPKWALDNGETYVMVGDPGAAILADYYAFGARNFDTAGALAAMVHQASTTNNDRPGLNYLTSPGFLPTDGAYGCCNFYGPVSTLLEYDTADFALSAFAGALGDTANQTAYANRAQNWKLVFNTGSGFAQPRLSNGAWVPGFDPSSGSNFVEGTSWQYTGMVPFNIRALADAKGGNSGYASYLDSVLSDFHGSGGTHADLGNEPSVELPWEYDYIGRPYRTQQVVRAVQDQLWPDSPANWGVGNDDLGTMSAWYVWSALGMFPETPGTSDLALGSPMFTQAVIALPSGNTLTINGDGAADNAPYVQSASWNGASWDNAYAPTAALSGGGTLSFTLGTAANTSWASSAGSAPPSYPGDGGPPFPGASSAGPISSGIAGKCVDVANGGTANGTHVQLSTCGNTTSQAWTVGADGTLRALGKCMDVTTSGTANGTKVQLYTCNGSGAQYWVPQANKALLNPESGKCLDDPNSSTTDGTQLQIWTCNASAAQQWTLPYPPIGAVSSALAGKCVDVDHSGTANGTHVQIWTCNQTGAQSWAVGSDGTLRAFGKCMDVTGGATANGTKVELWDCNGGGAQQWQYRTDGSLLNPQSGKCLDDPNSSTTDGAQLQIYTCNATNAQTWTLP